MNLFPVAYAVEIEEWTRIKELILNPFISFLFALAVVYFMYGVAKFIWNSGESAAKEEGKKHLLWGIVGLAIMVSVYGLINLMMATLQDLAG